MPLPNRSCSFIRSQSGAAAIMIMLVVILVGFGIFTRFHTRAMDVRLDNDKATAHALSEAKDALLGFAMGHPTRGYLPCPADESLVGTANEGNELPSCDAPGLRVGRLPWRTLGLGDIHDGNGDALWYAVSYDVSNDSPLINSAASSGLLSVNGKSGFAAIVFSSGAALSGQQRTAAVAPCATTGTAIRQYYCPTNYLDADALGVSNADADTTFTGAARTSTFNDYLLTISIAQFLSSVEKRVLQEAKAALKAYAANNPKGLYPWAMLAPHIPQTYSSAMLYADDATTLRGRLPDTVIHSVGALGWQNGTPLPCPAPCIGGKNWLMDWHELLFYGVASEFSPAGAGIGATGSLIVNGKHSVNAVVLLAGPSLSPTVVQPRSTLFFQDDVNNYLEGLDASTGFSFSNTSPPNNDHILIVAP